VARDGAPGFARLSNHIATFDNDSILVGAIGEKEVNGRFPS
jgi:hypothetical protein